MKERTAELITATVHQNADHNTAARRERHAQRLAEASLEQQEHLRTCAEKIRGTDSTKAAMNKSEWLRGNFGSVHTLVKILKFSALRADTLVKILIISALRAGDILVYFLKFRRFAPTMF